jgi:hypothetical protein
MSLVTAAVVLLLLLLLLCLLTAATLRSQSIERKHTHGLHKGVELDAAQYVHRSVAL